VKISGSDLSHLELEVDSRFTASTLEGEQVALELDTKKTDCHRRLLTMVKVQNHRTARA
jgi:hypothetical protein